MEILPFTAREVSVATIVSMLVQCGCGTYGNTKAFPGRHVENASKPPYTNTSVQITRFTNIVLPFPGGPNKSRPRAGALKPVKSCQERKTLSNNYC